MLIYGKNATGKTNLGKALLNIADILDLTGTSMNNGSLLNADTPEKTVEFSYQFRFDEHELVYRYARLDDSELVSEELLLDQVVVFRCDFEKGDFCFDHLDVVGAETANTDVYLQASAGQGVRIGRHQLPFLRWLISNVALKKQSPLIQLSDYVRRMSMINVGNGALTNPRRTLDNFYEALDMHDKLHDLEDFLNAMGIVCKLKLEKLPDGQRELYFAHEKLVPFYPNASSGTLALVDLYRRLISSNWNPSFIYLDEFDAFYHYEMSENVIRFFKKNYPKCQMIMTTHNTNLMTNRLMRPDCLFILSLTGSLTALCNATSRELREGHNLEKMYISGEFEKYE